MPGATPHTSMISTRTTPAGASGGAPTPAPAGSNNFWLGVGGICVAWAVFACCAACILCMRRKGQRAQKRPAKESFMSSRTSRSASSFMSGSTEAEDSDPDEQPLMDKRLAPAGRAGATPDMESQYMPVDMAGFQYAQQAGPPVAAYAGAQSMPPNQAMGLPPNWQAYANVPTQ